MFDKKVADKNTRHDTHTHSLTHARIQARTHSLTQTQKHTLTLLHTRILPYKHTQTHTLSHTPMQAISHLNIFPLCIRAQLGKEKWHFYIFYQNNLLVGLSTLSLNGKKWTHTLKVLFLEATKHWQQNFEPWSIGRRQNWWSQVWALIGQRVSIDS